jgi:ferric-dicitrate binding protein FerR (iron transport regulator)
MVVKNVDSKLLTMWKDGVLIVNGQSFDELIDNLSSWYGVEIVNNTSVSMKEKFNGRFDREDIKVALDAISISAKIKYKVINGKLILEDRQ